MPIKITPKNNSEQYPYEIIGTPQEAWLLLSQMEDIMAVKTCGICAGLDIRPSARPEEGPDGKFMTYKWFCQDCHSNLSLGVNKEFGGLFKKWGRDWFKAEKQAAAPPI